MINRIPDDATLQAYVDDQLDATQRLDVEACLATQPELAARVAQWRRDAAGLRAALSGVLAQPPQPRLDPLAIRRARRRRVQRRFALAASLVLALALGGVGGWQAKSERVAAAAPPMDDAVAAYRIFATDSTRPVEMDASRGPELQSWLSTRLGRPMSLPDLRSYGFALLGGRMLATPDGAAAMLMYQDGEGRRISFYVRPSTRFIDARGDRREDGLALHYWYRNGYGFAVVGRADDPRTLDVQRAIPPAV